MTPREMRDRLFKSGKPNIRPVELLEGSQYGKDMAVLWAAYQQGSFTELPELDQNEFSEFVLDATLQYSKGWIIEDRNPSYREKYGPVGMVLAAYNGWELEPQIEHFSWSTPRNRLRSVVSFFQMMRYDRDVGIVNVNALHKDKKFLKHVTKYGVLKYATRIPHGDKRGDRYIYWIRGGRKAA